MTGRDQTRKNILDFFENNGGSFSSALAAENLSLKAQAQVLESELATAKAALDPGALDEVELLKGLNLSLTAQLDVLENERTTLQLENAELLNDWDRLQNAYLLVTGQ